ncbi:MAG: hypothetical protein ACON5A_05595 [Candidatus Comchoanobacterales bacterium]
MNIPELRHFQNHLPNLATYLMDGMEQFSSHHMTSAKNVRFAQKLIKVIFDEWANIADEQYKRSLDILNLNEDRHSGWYFIPVDNIYSLEKGGYEFAMIIGYFNDRKCQSALMYFPLFDHVYLAQKGKGVSASRHNNGSLQSRLRIKDNNDIGNILVSCTSAYVQEQPDLTPLSKQGLVTVTGSVGHWLATALNEQAAISYHKCDNHFERSICLLFAQEASLYISNNDIIELRNHRI